MSGGGGPNHISIHQKKISNISWCGGKTCRFGTRASQITGRQAPLGSTLGPSRPEPSPSRQLHKGDKALSSFCIFGEISSTRFLFQVRF